MRLLPLWTDSLKNLVSLSENTVTRGSGAHQLVPMWDSRSSDTADFGDHMFASWELATRLMGLQRSLYISLHREGLASLACPLAPVNGVTEWLSWCPWQRIRDWLGKARLGFRRVLRDP